MSDETVYGPAVMGDPENGEPLRAPNETVDRVGRALAGTPVDSKGRLDGAEAVRMLLDSVEDHQDWNAAHPVNQWEAADKAVEVADEAVVRAALRRLLALHMHDLEATLPQVAVRNMKPMDVVKLHGGEYRVVELVNAEKETITIRAHQNTVRMGSIVTFANDRDVRVDLVERTNIEPPVKLRAKDLPDVIVLAQEVDLPADTPLLRNLPVGIRVTNPLLQNDVNTLGKLREWSDERLCGGELWLFGESRLLELKQGLRAWAASAKGQRG
jgi:hypothetical protein